MQSMNTFTDTVRSGAHGGRPLIVTYPDRVASSVAVGFLLARCRLYRATGDPSGSAVPTRRTVAAGSAASSSNPTRPDHRTFTTYGAAAPDRIARRSRAIRSK